MRTLKSKFCSGIGVSVTTDYPYVTVYAERHIGSSTRRGFVAGFMTYGKNTTFFVLSELLKIAGKIHTPFPKVIVLI